MSDLPVTFWDHISDLRRRLILVLVVFVVMVGSCLFFVTHIYDYLVAPLTKEHVRLVLLSPGEVVMVYLSMGGIVGIGLTLPFALYQVWRFVAPGLTPIERRYTIRLLPLALVMFVAGVCFAWFVVFPMILGFLVKLGEAHFSLMFNAASYFSFLSGICVPFGFVFELPIAVVFLTRIGIITPRMMRKFRRFAYLIIVVIGVLISPPELVSHLSVITPMIVLYEISILLSGSAYRRRQKSQVDDSPPS